MRKSTRIQFWILIVISLLLTFIYILGQTMTFISYDFTVAMELQEPAEEITEVGVAFNKGFGFGDTVVYIPLLLVGIIGMIKKKYWGFFTMTGALTITIYWPVVCLSTVLFAKGSPGFNFTDYLLYSILLPIIALYGFWGLLFIYKNRNELIITIS